MLVVVIIQQEVKCTNTCLCLVEYKLLVKWSFHLQYTRVNASKMFIYGRETGYWLLIYDSSTSMKMDKCSPLWSINIFKM
jgi:hypothetical protein